MREIKFRAWHLELKKIIHVYVIDQTGNGSEGYAKKNCRGWWGQNNQVLFSPDEVEWLQFTGLNDARGYEIFEGEICQVDRIDQHDGKEVRTRVNALVEWLPCSFTIGPIHVVRPFSIEHYNVEVIGNKFEQPELLTNPNNTDGGK